MGENSLPILGRVCRKSSGRVSRKSSMTIVGQVVGCCWMGLCIW